MSATTAAVAGPGPRPKFRYRPGWQENVPAELKLLLQWVVWRYIVRDGKWTKVPFCPRKGPDGKYHEARTNDPSTWGTWEEVLAALADKNGYFVGVGFVFSENDPYCGIDIDRCYNADGTIKDWAKPILDLVGGGYGEVSPSGQGLKLIVRAKLPPKGRKRGGLGPDGNGAYENYDSYRFFTITANIPTNVSGEIPDRQEGVEAVHAEMFPPKPAVERKPGPPPEPLNLTDQEVLAKAFEAKNVGATIASLYAGDILGHPSQSEADLALCSRLCFWLQGDRNRLDRVFRQSGLHREKWDEIHSSDGRTYGEMTIDAALAGWDGECYQGKRARRRKPSANGNGHVHGEGRKVVAEMIGGTIEGEATGEPAGESKGKRPDVEIDTLRHGALRQILACLPRHKGLYRRGTMLVTVAEETQEHSPLPGGKRLMGIQGSPKVIELSEANVGCCMTEVANFFRWENRGENGEPEAVDIHPPSWLIKAVATHGHWPGVRPLVAIAECPYPRDDGSIVQERGYDPETGTLYLPSMEFPPVPENPTQADAKQAAETLLKPVEQFPFATDQDKAVYLAGVLHTIARVSIPGPVPGIAVNGNAAGTGKGLLIDTIGNIATNRNVPTSGYPADPEEAAKVKVAIAIAGKLPHHFDNLDEGSTYGNSALDSALTADEIDDRILGSSRMTGAIPMRVCFFISGNNIAPGKDAHRRWLVANLVTALERPEERDDLAEKNLREYVRANRGELVKAALTILRAHALAGRPTGKWAPLGSFESWDPIVRGAIWWATGWDCCATRKQAAEDSPERAERLAVLQGWAELPNGKGEGYTVAEAVKLIDDSSYLVDDPYPTLRNALRTIPRLRGRDGRPSASSLGYYIRGIKGRNIGSLMFEKGDTLKHQAVVWKVVEIAAKPPSSQDSGEDTRMGEDVSTLRPRGQSSDTDMNMNGDASHAYRPEADDPPPSSYPPRQPWRDPDYAGGPR